MKKLLSMGLVAAAIFATGCGEDTNEVIQTSTGAQYKQIEQLARPGVNEGLLYTNSYLNTYNSVGPDFVAAALADPNSTQGQAAGPLFTEAKGVLKLLGDLNAADSAGPGFPAGVDGKVAAFLPDVMRIDSTLDVAVADTAYSARLNSKGSPVAGRKLTDDVIDITLTVLSDGAVQTDFVPYYPEDAPGNPGVGHHRLNNQAANFGAATFPFLAPAN